MSNKQIQRGEAQAHWNVSGTRLLKFTLELYHNGLKEHKLISAPEFDMLEKKALLQSQKWDEKWESIVSKKKICDEKEANLEEAILRTDEAVEVLKQIEDLLIYTLKIDDKVDWELFKKRDSYPEKLPLKPSQKTKKQYKPRPDKLSQSFVPTFTFFEKIFKSKKEEKIRLFDNKYDEAINQWENDKKSINMLNDKLDSDFKNEIKKWDKDVSIWENSKKIFLMEQEAYNGKIDKMKGEYLSKNNESILEYCEMVLNNSQYPEFFQKNFEIEYNSENKILIVEYSLPAIEDYPKIKEVKYIASKKELKESYITDSQLDKMFDDSIYKITLRTIHELFEADVVDALEAISFNGWVNSINKATGKENNNCILSIQVKKNNFLEIDLLNVDPKICFKNLKGVSSSKLCTLTPIQPILQISKLDKRFVAGYDVAYTIDHATNLAAMGWEDFEHLIRELFQKEFVSNGGEVKVTQASRDGGVDAIAFDPDPIRGGKIVIQAKRYTNTVGVSAVRDLYGTVMNEGATKGILVSTADYGSDSYEFAKGKPLTLLNGSNLLYLLQKHGHHAKIDLKEAKRILAERDN